jgi:hypothetical protein
MGKQKELLKNQEGGFKCPLADVSDSDFMLIIQGAINLAFEAGKWEGQIELEEHYDREQYSRAIIEVAHSEKNAMPLSKGSTGNTVVVNLRSDKWREGVRKSAREYLEKAMVFAVAHYRSLVYIYCNKNKDMDNKHQPAFAVSKEICEKSEITEYPYGLTKREYIAAMAMQGLLSQYNLKQSSDQNIIAQLSVELADALLDELEM